MRIISTLPGSPLGSPRRFTPPERVVSAQEKPAALSVAAAFPPLAPPWPASALGEGAPLLMGIVNITPDSFSDGGQFLAQDAALAHMHALVAEGADLLDLGAESTRPGHVPLSEQEELARLAPIFGALEAAPLGVPLSLDTAKAAVAARGVRAGVRILNDIWALRDPDMARVAAQNQCGLVLMHNRETLDPAGDSLEILAQEMRVYFARALEKAVQAGVSQSRIALDPGIGFGKNLPQNLLALRLMPDIARALGCAFLVGVSRKSMLGAITGRPVSQRQPAGVAAALLCAQAGASVLRVHDPGAHADAIRVWQALEGKAFTPK